MSTNADQLLTRAIKAFVEESLDERATAPAKVSPATPEPLDERTKNKIAQYALLAHKPYLTRKEAAAYLDVSPRSIAEWSARPPDENPFPEGRAGGEPRTKREEIDKWVEREGARRRLRAVK